MTDSTTTPRPDDDARAAVTPPTHEVLPLVSLAVEHVFDTLTREPVFPPTLLALTSDGQRGMWTLPDMAPEEAAARLAEIDPTPALAVAVFDGEIETEHGPRPAVAVEAFDAAVAQSTRLLFEYAPGVPGTDLAAHVEGEPHVVANGPNPLHGRV